MKKYMCFSEGKGKFVIMRFQSFNLREVACEDATALEGLGKTSDLDSLEDGVKVS